MKARQASLIWMLMVLFACSSQLCSAAPAAREAASSETGEVDEQQNRQLNRERFRHDHSDSSGFVRPDLWRKGMEHARQMDVVRGIGSGASRVRPSPYEKSP